MAEPAKTHRTSSIPRLLLAPRTHTPHATTPSGRGTRETGPPQGLEALVRQHEDPAVVRLQVVDLFAEDGGPEVFAEEFYGVEGGDARAGCGGGAGGG